MKKIVLKVTVEVPDDYILDDPSWLLENIGIGYDYDVERILIYLKNKNTNPYKLHVGFSQILLATSR